MMRRSAAATVIISCLVAAFPAAAWPSSSSWTPARATFYGRDAWPIHNGACGFGFICPKRWTDDLAQGMDTVAVSDKSQLFTGSQCGQCLEVRCRDGSFKDGLGEEFDRSGLCKPGSKVVKVKITDECPCEYPGNAVSNKRWCCGDMEHLDVSQWALEKIVKDADRWGVFAIEYRRVECDQPVKNEAPNLGDVPKDPHADLKPRGLDCGQVARTYAARGRQSRAITRRQNAVRGRNKGYWAGWWDRAKNWSYARKAKLYKQIWDRIRAGDLTSRGHGRN